jgi:hypothetical protein
MGLGTNFYMKLSLIAKTPFLLLVFVLWLVRTESGRAQTNYTVTTPNLQYAVNGVILTNAAPGFFVSNSPPLTLVAGNTYTFTMQAASVHPMVVVTQFTGSPPSSFAYSNASPQVVSSGTITLHIPATNFPSTLYYQCNIHGFYGAIHIIPPPPASQIISLSVTTNIVMLSTGTNTLFTLVPQYNSNLVTGVWQAVPAYTNTFDSGTNTTTFDRLDALCGPNTFLRISQQPPPGLSP